MEMCERTDCKICQSSEAEAIYSGDVRDGKFGSFKKAQILRCTFCGADRIEGVANLSLGDYETDFYRNHIGQNHDVSDHHATHDHLVKFTLDAIWPQNLRNKLVGDVGCGAGALLDHLCGVTNRDLIAVEPSLSWESALVERGYKWFSSCNDALEIYQNKLDYIFSVQVIEHVEDPRLFLADLKALLAPEGRILISTPNRNDILMKLLPDEFSRFFYRTQHMWYFDVKSLENCANRAGLTVDNVCFKQRYPLSNTVNWLKSKIPSGSEKIAFFDQQIDSAWRVWLEENAMADNIYLILKHTGVEAQ
ncbi:class I SAM-dependent methyltransferase [Amylibacter sp.]|nr:class I SAM-dependent methyltransferase [Amylibacter sp.]MDC1414283.1 class I SAM-dependent methyltransferase [Amylibacter sp.]